jgi:hypothetical protein
MRLPDRLDRPAFLVAISAILAAPCLIFADAPLFDLPVHIARQHILYDPSIAIAREHYQVLWRVLPNLALDLFVWVCHFALTIEQSVRLFLAVTVVQLFLGAVALNRALFGANGRFGIYAMLLPYSGLFLIGLINLCFGVGLSLWVFALWIRLRGTRYGFLPCGLLAILVLLSHLYAFGLYALLVGGHALGEAVSPEPARPLPRRLLPFAGDVAHLAIPVAFYFGFVPRGFNDFLPVFWEPKEKIWAFFTTLGVYNLTFDMACLVVVIYLLMVTRRRLVLAPPMRVPLACLAVAFLVLPYQLGQATWVDARVPSTFAIILVASLNWKDAERRHPVADTLIGGLFLVRMAVMAIQWWGCQPVYAAYHAAFLLMEPGAKLLPINTHPSELRAAERPPVPHMDAIAVSERGAYIPTMLADRPYELLHYTPRDRALHASFDDDPAIADYDYVLIEDPDAVGIPAGVEPIYRGPGFVLGRVGARTGSP